ncbi:hypothetical protein GN244_ATG03795 [Phytophthora infestans]|uniref:Uncharacterized protein n=1 Tax=Phytophthora infestans TaxID=4787 RepID=A0A833SPB2_PHYIN|nr:hypothetical protein GN244_ATG03795 [Phytophthora infestans]KAF4134091.1 hypothetical protein GN958_ATG16773 [Phytophthora infestans]
MFVDIYKSLVIFLRVPENFVSGNLPVANIAMARFKTDGGVVEVQRATPAVARRLRESLAKTTRLLADFER